MLKTMARANTTVTGDESLDQDLNCSICLELLNEPVTLPNCFHSFCKNCLEQTISGARDSYRNPYTCPQCRHQFNPSDVGRINQHLQSIVESHRRGQERRAEAQSQVEDQRNASADLERLHTVLSTAETVVQSLVTAMDQTSLRTVRSHERQRVPLSPVDTFGSVEDTVPLLSQDQNVQTDCVEFEAETSRQFWDRSATLFRRHFLLIIFMIHAFIFVVCLFKAMV